MRKRYRVLILAVLVAAIVVPVGFALSTESASFVARASQPASIVSSVAVVKPSLVPPAAAAAPVTWPGSDPVKLLAVGTMFLAVAAGVRRII